MEPKRRAGTDWATIYILTLVGFLGSLHTGGMNFWAYITEVNYLKKYFLTLSLVRQHHITEILWIYYIHGILWARNYDNAFGIFQQ
jgi:hypothetical protein